MSPQWGAPFHRHCSIECNPRPWTPGPACKSWASETALRLREAGAWTTGSTGHSIILSNQKFIPHITDYVPPIVNFEKKYKVFIPTRTDCGNLPHQIENAVNIYKHSFNLNSQTGGGVFSPELDIKVSFRPPDHCNVFQAEVMAILEATSEHHDADIYIFSTSQAALRVHNTIITCHTSRLTWPSYNPNKSLWLMPSRAIVF